MTAERTYIAFLYSRLDAERAAAAAELAGVMRTQSDGSTETLWQRDVAANALSASVARLRVAEDGLCFGRLDRDSGERLYIGRTGLFDEHSDYQPLLVDWRAPVARPFYCATSANPEGVTRRRHFRTSGRRLVDFHDDLLERGVAAGDEALLAALNAPRSETMNDIVATIQAEQDEVIRLPHTGAVVIDGGPGTGKTVVALHRVAYLLYTHRERMARRGVLIIGPNTAFLRYIGDVLPSLGETDVVFATPGELLPGLATDLEDRPECRRVKGGIAMVDVLTTAIADRQELPAEPIAIELDDVVVHIDAELAERARKRARATGLRHNLARPTFRDALILELAEQAVDRIGADWTGWLDVRDDVAGLAGELAADTRRELTASHALAAAVEKLWPVLTPQRLLRELFESPDRLTTACAGVLTDADRAALHRPAGSAWTVADVPLLDEAAEQLGPVDDSEAVVQRELHEQQEYARGVLDILDTDEDPDEELLRAVDLLDEERLAERHVERDTRTLAERAAADREWTYGHVVVDEAQELSEMDWRLIMRRCPSRSCTIVGDLAQRESPAGARSWGSMLRAYVSDRWTYRQLTINYRMPAEIMDVAAALLSTLDAAVPAPKSVRSTGDPPWFHQAAPGELGTAISTLARREQEALGEGSVAVIVPDDLRLPEELDAGIAAMLRTPREAKGLEFDSVIVVEPAGILGVDSERPSGAAELYVALTRATRRLGILHAAPLPAFLAPFATAREAGA